MEQPLLLIFDFDGTLADTCRGILYTYHATISELSLPERSDDELKATIGVPLSEGFRMLFPDYTEDRLEEIVRHYRHIYNRDKKEVSPQLFPGVKSTLAELHRSGCRMAVASSRSSISLKEMCEHTGIAGYFEMIIGADETARHKPYPDPVFFIIDNLDVPADRAAVVGDMPYDIVMGASAGCDTIGVTYGNSDRKSLTEAGAEVVIESFPDLLKVIGISSDTDGFRMSAEHETIPDWTRGTACAITVCDKNCRIIYMNDKARETFSRHGNLIGADLMACHNPRSQAIISRLLSEGGTNCYTISKGGVRKMIYQTAWYAEGVVGGLVEISMVIPEEMPHYIRS